MFIKQLSETGEKSTASPRQRKRLANSAAPMGDMRYFCFDIGIPYHSRVSRYCSLVKLYPFGHRTGSMSLFLSILKQQTRNQGSALRAEVQFILGFLYKEIFNHNHHIIIIIRKSPVLPFWCTIQISRKSIRHTISRQSVCANVLEALPWESNPPHKCFVLPRDELRSGNPQLLYRVFSGTSPLPSYLTSNSTSFL